MNRVLFSIVFFTLSLSGIGQKIVPSPQDLYADVLEYLSAGEYAEALPLLLTLQEKGYQTANISYLIGECYLNTEGQKIKAIPFLKEATLGISDAYSGSSLEEKFAPSKAWLLLGIAYRLNNNFSLAVQSFNTFIGTLDAADTDNRALAGFHTARCHSAEEMMAAPAHYLADTLPERIHASYVTYNPLLSADEQVLYFMRKLKFYDAIMQAHQTNPGWTDPENLTPMIKSDGDHDLTGVSADGSQILLTFYDPYRSGEIFAARFEHGQWSELIKLNDNINTIFNESHASLSHDGKRLYFTSDRKGGYGGLDIYCSFLGVNGWEAPVNLGPLVNSPFNEESPFILPDDNKLFFSSQGHYNMGGYDIFMCSKDTDGRWLPPVNLGYPISTTDDDLFFFPLGTGTSGYQSVNTFTHPGRSIVRYRNIVPGRPLRYTVNGLVSVGPDSMSSGTDKVIVDVFEKSSGLRCSRQSLQKDGSFNVKLAGGAYRFDFMNDTRTLLSKDLLIPDYFPGDALLFNAELELPFPVQADTLMLRNILFGFDQSIPDEQSNHYLDSLAAWLLRYPEILVSVNGYADARGSAAYNQKLSMQRAKIVADYLVRINIPSGRLQVHAFGENFPVALNCNFNGTDNPQGRSYNRRVELILQHVPSQLILIAEKKIPAHLLVLPDMP